MSDVVVIGGGQAGLAAGYFLRRAGLDFVILDDQEQPGGAWQHGWQSLRMFSPAQYSPLPGWSMPAQVGETFPHRRPRRGLPPTIRGTLRVAYASVGQRHQRPPGE
ncbi:FAD-dependent oxidoreductase [Brevibacterium sp. BDJS002]|uniref:FAD-dependent oxidoreductase n=1 Tax=Brevibacterium TaxID=1696 RepID=UPI001D1983BC|nr:MULTISPECIES: FAD-dependent oxidoreductase [Brevibacterium]WCE38511.1 FAD-dependent oxidoreductase [Brevibacterium sp. BDJS002]